MFLNICLLTITIKIRDTNHVPGEDFPVVKAPVVVVVHWLPNNYSSEVRLCHCHYRSTRPTLQPLRHRHRQTRMAKARLGLGCRQLSWVLQRDAVAAVGASSQWRNERRAEEAEATSVDQLTMKWPRPKTREAKTLKWWPLLDWRWKRKGLVQRFPF